MRTQRVYRLFGHFICLYSIVLTVLAQAFEEELELREELFKNYSAKIRPVKNVRSAVHTRVDYTPVAIVYLDEKSQILSSSAWFDVMWFDEILRWDPERFAGITELILPMEEIWIPDLVVINSIQSNKKIYDVSTTVTVNNSGHVTWWPGRELQTKCKVDITKYPFDKQICVISVEKWSHSDEKQSLDIGPRVTEMGFYEPSNEWDLHAVHHHKKLVDIYGQNFTRLEWHIVLHRKAKFFVLNIILPVILLSVINIFCYVIPPASGEKISLSISLFLTFAVYMTLIMESFPKSSEHISLLGLFISIQLCYSGLTIIMSSVILELHYRGNAKVCRGNRVFSMCCKSCKKAYVVKDTENKDDEKGADERLIELTCMTWRQLSEKLNRALFTLFIILNVISTCLFLGLLTS